MLNSFSRRYHPPAALWICKRIVRMTKVDFESAKIMEIGFKHTELFIIILLLRKQKKLEKEIDFLSAFKDWIRTK
jgi:hypothetical protein